MQTRLFILVASLFVLTFAVNAQDGPPPMPPMPEIDGEIFAEGLHSPQGVFVDADGNVWVVENGTGGEEEIAFGNPQTYQVETGTIGETSRVIRIAPDGTQEVMALLNSVAVGMDVLAGGRITTLGDAVYFTQGHWIFVNGENTYDWAAVVSRLEDGEDVLVANIWDYEDANNPDGNTLRESHPYGITPGPDDMLYVVDAAGNSLLRLDPESGDIETVTAFEPLPGIFPNQWEGGRLVAQAVPTGVAFLNNEWPAYVSYLSGAPFVPGNARVVAVTEDGAVSDFATGLTMLTDVKAGPDGNLYATQFALFTQQGPQPNSGNVIRIMPDGTSELVVTGLPLVTSLDFNADGDGYVAINGQGAPGTGMIVYYEDLVSREGMPMPEMAGPPPAGDSMP